MMCRMEDLNERTQCGGFDGELAQAYMESQQTHEMTGKDANVRAIPSPVRKVTGLDGHTKP